MDSSVKPPRYPAVVSLVGMAAILVGLDLSFRASAVAGRLRRERIYLVKPAAFDASPQAADILVVGDSRVGADVDPAVVERDVLVELGRRVVAYNAGLPGAPPMAHLAWVRRALSRAPHPAVVVLSISPYMFSSRIARVASRESLTTMYRVVDLPAMARAGAPAEDMASVLFANAFEAVRQRPRLLELALDFGGYHEPVSPGVQGYEPNAEVDAATQEARAHGRAIGYRVEMWRPEAHFGSEQVGYFVESLRELQASGVRTVVMNSLSASQLELAYGPRSIYAEHVAFVRATAARFGATYFDAKASPAVRDEDFHDGDHLAGNGAERFTAWLTHEAIVGELGAPPADRDAACRTVFDFEAPGLPGWIITGDVAEEPTSAQGRRGQHAVYGYRGHAFFNSWGALADRSESDAMSPPFVLDGATVRVRVGGGARGSDTEDLGVALVVDGREVATAAGGDTETMRDVVWDTAALRGRTAAIHIRDHATGGWGHITVDDIAVCP